MVRTESGRYIIPSLKFKTIPIMIEKINRMQFFKVLFFNKIIQ